MCGEYEGGKNGLKLEKQQDRGNVLVISGCVTNYPETEQLKTSYLLTVSMDREVDAALLNDFYSEDVGRDCRL